MTGRARAVGPRRRRPGLLRSALATATAATALAGATALTTAGATVTTLTAATLAPPPPIAWSPCPTEAGYRCGTVPVPVGYRHPDGPTIPLAVIEKPAAGPAPSHGALLFNPGGPGESGVQILPVLASLVPAAVADRFDLVSFDERGTGASDLLACGPSPASVAALDPLPSRSGAPLPATTLSRRLARSCRRRYPSMLPETDTTVAARDMDRIRQALGVRRISYWGLSYGTVLGSVYAHRFPDHVRAMILDGAVDATLPLTTQAAAEAPAVRAALRHFLATCGGRTPCPLGPHPAATYHRLAAELQRSPLPGPNGSQVTVGDLDTATLFALSVPAFAASFPTALVSATGGDGGPLQAMALGFEQDLDGTSLVGPQWAYVCNDARGHPGPQAAGRLARALAARDGSLAAYTVTYDLGGCVDWPAPVHPVTALRVASGPRILVIGNTGDPNTPHSAAVRLSAALGRATLLTWHGWGHTWLLNGSGDACMQQAVVAYLTSGRVPGRDASCR